MEYVMSSRWSLMEHFDITDGRAPRSSRPAAISGARISLLDSAAGKSPISAST